MRVRVACVVCVSVVCVYSMLACFVAAPRWCCCRGAGCRGRTVRWLATMMMLFVGTKRWRSCASRWIEAEAELKGNPGEEQVRAYVRGAPWGEITYITGIASVADGTT